MTVHTHTIAVKSKLSKSGSMSRMATQSANACSYCIVATATARTVALVKAELAADKALTAELEAKLTGLLEDVGFQTYAAFDTALRARKALHLAKWVVEDLQTLAFRINKRLQAANLIQTRDLEVGEQVAVSWTKNEASAKEALDSARLAPYRRQGYELAVRTDIEVTSKLERSKF